MSTHGNKDPAANIAGSLHLQSLDAAARVLLDHAMKGAEQGFFSVYAAAGESVLKDPEGKEPDTQLRGAIIILAADIPEADMRALNDYVNGMAQDVIVVGSPSVKPVNDSDSPQ